MPIKRGKKVGQAIKEKDLCWTNCEECGRLELVENSERKEDSGDGAVFQCRMCQMEEEISKGQKKMEAKVSEMEKQMTELTKTLRELEKGLTKIKIDIGSKVEVDAVEPMFDRVSALEAAQAELVVNINDMKGDWPTVAEANVWTTVTSKKQRKDAREREDEAGRAITATCCTTRDGKKAAAAANMINEGSKKVVARNTIKKASKKLYGGASAIPFKKAGKEAGTGAKSTGQRKVSKPALKEAAVEKAKKPGAKSGAMEKTVARTTGEAQKRKSGKVEAKEAQKVENKGKKPMSFGEKCKDLKEGAVVLVGDSMIRGVGEKLRRDNILFTPIANGGARIESVTWSLRNKQVKVLREDSHLLVMVGTNNLKGEGTEVIMSKYKELVATMKEVKCKKLSIVGILTRGDENEYLESKRIGLNLRLGKLCAKNGVEFLDPSSIYDTVSAGRPETERKRVETRVLDRWGLHLNAWGQDQVARVLFKHCVKYLN